MRLWMVNWKGCAWVGAVLPACACLSGCVSKHYAEPAVGAPASYYPLAVGDQWTYKFVPDAKKDRRFDMDVTESKVIGGTKTYAVAIDQSYSYMAVIPTGVFQFAQGEPEQPTSAVVFDPPQRIYKLPFVVGDEWHTPVLSVATDPKSTIVNLYGRVEEIEDVTVPAGTFKDCVRVLVDDPRDVPENVTETWFAPNVGIVQTQTAITRDNRPTKSYKTELVSYSLK